jgi:hypothetical protein
MIDDSNWTPAKGWRKAAVRLLICGAASMAISFGAVCLMVKMFGEVSLVSYGRLPYISWRLLGPLAAITGAIGGGLVSCKLVENTGVYGVPLTLAACAVLVGAHIGAACLGLAVFGSLWKTDVLMMSGACCLAAVLLSIGLLHGD